MITKKRGTMIFGLVSLFLIADIIRRVVLDKELGLFEILPLAVFILMFFSFLTWGDKGEKNGIYQEEELGQKIKERSAKISYYILVVVILLAVVADRMMNETYHLLLLSILGIAIVILPIVEYFVSKKYK